MPHKYLHACAPVRERAQFHASTQHTCTSVSCVCPARAWLLPIASVARPHIVDDDARRRVVASLAVVARSLHKYVRLLRSQRHDGQASQRKQQQPERNRRRARCAFRKCRRARVSLRADYMGAHVGTGTRRRVFVRAHVCEYIYGWVTLPRWPTAMATQRLRPCHV